MMSLVFFHALSDARPELRNAGLQAARKGLSKRKKIYGNVLYETILDF
jgi:hypothetical protein